MWVFFSVAIALAALLFVATMRSLVIAAVERVRTREPRTLAELRFIVHLLHGDPCSIPLFF